MENQLETLAKKYGTDKQMSGHGYTEHYYRHFKDIQNLELKILEIGVHKGFSLCMWADWFSNSQIYGIDDGSTGDLRSVYDNPRINFRLGKQSDPNFIESLVKEAGYFDIVIDDGSHFSTDIIPSLNYLYQHTKKFYVIEDLQTSYSPYTDEPQKQRFNSHGQTATAYLSKIIDMMHTSPNKFVNGFHIYKEICFLEK